MKQLEDINIGAMSNGAHFSFMERVLKRVKADPKVTATIGKLVSSLEAAFAEEDKYLALSRKNMKTDEIAQADARRDRLYRCLRQVVKAFVEVQEDKFTAPATILWQSLKDYNVNPAAQMDKESGMLTNLIDDLQGLHTAHLKALALDELVVILKTANEQVKTMSESRVMDRMGVSTGALRAARLKTDEAYRNMVQVINGYVLLNGEEELGTIIDVLNLDIQHFKREVLKQRTGTPATSEPEGTDKPGDTETPGGEDTPGTGGDTPGTGGTTPGTGGGNDGDEFV